MTVLKRKRTGKEGKAYEYDFYCWLTGYPNVHLFPLDVTKPEQIETTVSAVLKEHDVDVLFNNAGYGMKTRFEDMTEEAVQRSLNTNLEVHMIGNIVTVKVDRPMGSYHPEHKDMYYPINYGYIEGIIAPDGEEQDAYLLGLDEPVQEYTGTIIAIIHRYDDVEEKWVVAPKGMIFTKEEIKEQTYFQEQYFKSEIRM